MSQIPQDTIDRVRDTADIVDIISQYVDLKQRGPNFFGLCPFHNEKTPSFSVAPQKQIYYCFGCQSGGNVFSFLMDYLKLPFPDAVKDIAGRYNLNIVFESTDENSDFFSSLYKLHAMSTELYQKNLFSKVGEDALNYLKERGLNEDTIKQFKIGFASADWDKLVSYFKGKGFKQSQILESGLFTHSDKGIFDRFRSRIMFPIFHPSGKPIGFGGRIFGVDDSAKYLNSPETPLYKKSSTFYGLQATRDSIRKEGKVILVEGYMDFLKLYQSNIYNVISVSGTAFSPKHSIALNKIAKEVILLFDGDKAGGNAAIRTGWVLLQSGLIPSVVQPPDGLDPDDWINRRGIEEVILSIKSPMDYIDFHIKFNDGIKITGADRQKYIFSLAKEVKGIDDGVIRNDMVKAISEKLLIDEQDFIRAVNSQRFNITKGVNNSVPISNEQSFTNIVDKAQIELIQLLACDDKELKKKIIDSISLELFTNPLLNKLAKILIDVNLDVGTSTIIEYFQDKNERDSVAKILFTKDQNNLSEEIVFDCMKILKSEPIKKKISSLRIKIREKESIGEDPSEELRTINKLRIELNDI